MAADAALWDGAWAWRDAAGARPEFGTVDRVVWRTQSRFAACNASFAANSHDAAAVRPIALCEPAATESLQALCGALLQYRTDVQNVNCILAGDGTCLYQPGAFYVPYAWSPTNQRFAADSVLAYYGQSVLGQPRFASNKALSLDALCPARSDFLGHLAALSQAQATRCPGYQMEFLKDLLETLKQLGHDLLYMGFCAVMFGANALGAVFADSAYTADSMMQLASSYLGRFIEAAAGLIMPILDAIVTVLFGTSGVGKLIKTALVYLCETYNFYIKYVLRPPLSLCTHGHRFVVERAVPRALRRQRRYTS